MRLYNKWRHKTHTPHRIKQGLPPLSLLRGVVRPKGEIELIFFIALSDVTWLYEEVFWRFFGRVSIVQLWASVFFGCFCVCLIFPGVSFFSSSFSSLFFPIFYCFQIYLSSYFLLLSDFPIFPFSHFFLDFQNWLDFRLVVFRSSFSPCFYRTRQKSSLQILINPIKTP